MWGATRRRFTLEFKTEAVHRQIDSGRSAAEVARELSIEHEAFFGRIATSAGT